MWFPETFRLQSIWALFWVGGDARRLAIQCELISLEVINHMALCDRSARPFDDQCRWAYWALSWVLVLFSVRVLLVPGSSFHRDGAEWPVGPASYPRSTSVAMLEPGSS